MASSEVIQIVLNLVDNVSKGLDAITTKTATFESKVKALSSAFAPLSNAASGALGASTKAAADFDKAVQSAAKAMDLTQQQTEKFKTSLGEVQKNLNFQFAQKELADVAATAGKLGIASKDVDKFTETIAKLAIATDQTGKIDELATNAAKIASVYKLNTDQVKVFGDAINKLDDRFATTSPDLLNFSKRTVGLGASSKASAQEIAAFGATLMEAGQAPEVAGTFMNAFMQKLGGAENLSKKAKAALGELGYSAKDMATAFDQNAVGSMTTFLGKIKELDTISQRRILGAIFGQEHVSKAMALVQNSERLNEALKMVGDTSGNAAKTQAEFERQTNSLSGQMATFKNATEALGISIGSALLPGLNSLLNGAVLPLMKALTDITTKYPIISSIIATLLGLTAVVAPVLSIAGGIAQLVAVMPLLATATAGAGAAFAAMSAPVLAVVAAIAAVGVGIYALVTAFNAVKPQLAAFWENEKKSVTDYGTWLKNDLNNAVTTFKNLYAGAKTASDGYFTAVKASLGNMKTDFDGFASNVKTSLTNAFQAGKQAVTEFVEWVKSSISSLSSAGLSWGKGLVDGFVSGIKQNMSSAASAVGEMTKGVSQYLPQSDAEKGALSRLTASGIALGETFMAGLRQSGLSSYLGSYLQPMGAQLSSPPLQQTLQTANAGVGSIVFNITGSKADADEIVKALKTRERQLIDLISNATSKLNRRMY